MPAGQFVVNIVPRGTIVHLTQETHQPKAPVSTVEDAGEFDGLWKNCEIDSPIESALSGMLQEMESWSLSARMFGRREGDKIEIWKKDGKLEWIKIGFSLAHPNATFMRAMINLAGEFNCIFWDIEIREILNPQPIEFLYHIKKSSARRYLPENFTI